MADFPITKAPTTISRTHDLPVHKAKTADGVTHSRKKHSNKVVQWNLSYTFTDHSDVDLIEAHYETNRTDAFKAFDWRTGSSVNIPAVKWVSWNEAVNDVGNYVVNVVFEEVAAL